MLPLLHEVRAVKSKKEISHILTAQKISESVLKEILNELCVGVSEKVIVKLIEDKFKGKGIEALPFRPIVAFGKSTADIHHVPGETKLKRGDLVMFDLGVTISGYCSDMTRTYIFGNPTEKQKKLNEIIY